MAVLLSFLNDTQENISKGKNKNKILQEEKNVKEKKIQEQKYVEKLLEYKI